MAEEDNEDAEFIDTLNRYREQATTLFKENAVEILLGVAAVGVGVGIIVYQMQRRSRIEQLKRTVRRGIKKTGIAEAISKGLSRVL